MWNLLKTVLKHCTTERDNQTFDLGRLLAALAVLVAIGLTIYTVAWRGDRWDMQSYGVGLGAVFLAVGGYISMKKEKDNA